MTTTTTTATATTTAVKAKANAEAARVISNPIATMTMKEKEKVTASAVAAEKQNPLLHRQQAFLDSIPIDECDNFFNDDVVSTSQRAQLWSEQADLGEQMVNQYAWATPTNTALRVLRHFSPLIEIGCGANAYWCQQMMSFGSIDVIAYDRHPNNGGKIDKQVKKLTTDTSLSSVNVRKGGPEVLQQPANVNRTLFLCYPDENEASEGDEEDTVMSMGSSCLEHYQGTYVVHVGELFSDVSNLAVDMAPWGRSSSPEFQQRLAAEYHCLLRIMLPNWLHTRDTLTVWKRSKTCVLVFALGDSDDDDGDDNNNAEHDDAAEEVLYRHIPANERLPSNVAAPCLQHLLLHHASDDLHHGKNEATPDSPDRMLQAEPEHLSADPPRHKKKRSKLNAFDVDEQHEEYSCPW